MRVLICGGRKFNDWEFFRDTLEKIALKRFPRSEPDQYGNFLYEVIIISGGAKGADQMAIDWAIVNWCPFEEYKADWDDMSKPCFPKMKGTKVYNALAGLKRNQRMIDEGKPDLVIAFPGGNGTKDMISRANKSGIEVIEVEKIFEE